MTFAQPYYFLLFLLLIPLILWHFLLKGKRESTLTLSTTDPYRQLPRTPRTALIHLPFLLRILTFACIIFALARPQTHNALSNKETEGINISQFAASCRLCEHDKACSDAIAEAGRKNRDAGRNAAKKHTPDLLGNGPCLVAIELELGRLFDC